MAMELESILALLAVLISVVSAYLSRRALDAQISISKNTAFFTQKAAAEEYLAQHPELLELHGIEPHTWSRSGSRSMSLSTSCNRSTQPSSITRSPNPKRSR